MMEIVDIDKDKVNECMDSSFKVHGDWQSNNQMLADDRKTINDLGVALNPSLTINGHPYSGELSGKEIFKAICHAHSIND